MDRPDIAIEGPEQPEILAMLAASDAYYAALYPTESNHLLDVASLKKPGVTFFVARIAGAVKGFGSVVRQNGYGEIKRMYVDPSARGHRLGRLILDRLEAHAKGDGLALLRLETGIRQPEALGLYRSSGFRETGPFGDYRPDPLSLFMAKRLDG
ncbi:MAG: GNAT family N-acetyltransferase [Alphaproteobacteria bacterium]|nr:GNAT family N-acetyltransferase [Alphaproteobacteria bacterium]